MQTILYIDHIESYRLLLQEELSEEGYQVIPAESIEDALSKSKNVFPDLIILEFRNPGLKEKSFENLKKYYPDIPCIGYSTSNQCPREYQKWINHYIPKLPDTEDIKKLIKKIATKK